MEISIYEIIKKPLLSEKAQRASQEQHKLVLEVHPHANKPLIKAALKKLFNVEVENVNILIRKGKKRNILRRRVAVKGSDRKIAWVTLKEGYSLDLFGTGEGKTMPKEREPQEAKEKK